MIRVSREEAIRRLDLYEQRMWEHAVRARPRNRVGRALFKWMWRHHMDPPWPGITAQRVVLFMTVVELRTVRDRR